MIICVHSRISLLMEKVRVVLVNITRASLGREAVVVSDFIAATQRARAAACGTSTKNKCNVMRIDLETLLVSEVNS